MIPAKSFSTRIFSENALFVCFLVLLNGLDSLCGCGEFKGEGQIIGIKRGNGFKIDLIVAKTLDVSRLIRRKSCDFVDGEKISLARKGIERCTDLNRIGPVSRKLS